MTILHVISDINRSSGGPSRSVQGLVASMRSSGVDVWLMTINHGAYPWIKGCEQFVNGGVFEVELAKVKPDIVHLHGIWDPRLHRCAVICRRWHIPYVVAPRGMLEPWSLKQKWLKKRIARFLYQDRDLHLAAALHATAESEAAQFRKLGFKNPVIISPNGVNVPDTSIIPNSSFIVPNSPRRALFVSRMHPKKGVFELVESWSRVKPTDWQCELVYTLNGDAEKEYEAKVKQRVHELGIDKSFIFTGPLNDDEKWKAYTRANLFVLPTYSENFGIVVAEALWAGVPVITTKGTPWQELETHRCGWWIDLPPTSSLDSALCEATSSSTSNLNLFGQNGHALVEAKYTWPAVCKSVITGYEAILSKDKK